jgi:hypothetical protein
MQEGRQKEECRRQKTEGKGRFGNEASAEGYAIQMGALSEYYLGNAALREGARPREPKPIPASGKSGLAKTLALPAEISLAWPGTRGHG